MALERIQALHNRQIANDNNISGSNDPAQKLKDANKSLLVGAAELIAEGTPAKAITAAYQRELRRQQRQGGTPFSKRDFERQMAQANNTVRSDQGTAELPGVGYREFDDEAYAFGEDVEYNRFSRGAKITRADDEQTYTELDRGFIKDEDTGLIRRETFTESRPLIVGEMPSVRTGRGMSQQFPGRGNRLQGYIQDVDQALGYEGANAPKSALVDALSRLEMASQYGYDAFPGAAAVAGRLEDDIKPNREAENSLVADLVSSERRGRKQKAIETLRQIAIAQKAAGKPLSKSQALQLLQEISPSGAKAFSDENVYRETQRIAREGFLTGGQAALADEAIGRIAEIRKLGTTGEMAQVIRQMGNEVTGQAIQPTDMLFPAGGGYGGYGPALDAATGAPLGAYGPERSPNNSGTANNLNSPQTALNWVQQTRPDLSPTNFGSYPQVDISRETTNFANKLRELGRQKNISYLANIQGQNIRSIDELQSISQRANRELIESGNQMYIKDSEGDNVPAGNRIVSGLMNKLRMGSGDEERLANSLYQLDAARRSSVNQNPTGTYLNRGETYRPKGLVFDAPEAVGSGLQIAQQSQGTSIKTGTNPDGSPINTDIVAALRQLKQDDAAKPYIGAVAGEPKARPSYIRTKARDPQGIRGELRAKALGTYDESMDDYIKKIREGKSKKKPQFNEARTEENIISAQGVQRRADEGNTRRAQQMDEVIRSLPSSALRSYYPLDLKSSRRRRP